MNGSADSPTNEIPVSAENILETIREPLLILDADLRVRYLNRSFCRVFRVSVAETQGQLLPSLGDGQWDIPELRRLLNEILPQNSFFDDFQVQHQFPGIGERIMRLNARRVAPLNRDSDDSGKAYELILLAFEDLTEQHRAEQQRKDIETRFTSLVKNIKSHSIFTLDPQGYITSWNREAENILGFSESEVLQQHFSIIFTDRDQQDGIPQQELDISLEVGRAEDERWHRRRDGELFWALGIVTPTIDADGRHTGFSKILRDMTDRKRAEEQLRDARSRLHSTLAAGEIGTWDWDVLNDRVYADQNLAAMFGITPEEANGGSVALFMQAIHPDDRDRVGRQIREALESGQSYDTEYRVVGDSIRWVIARGRVERDQTGQAVRLPGVVIDVTERIRSERELKRVTASSERQRRVYETALSNTADFVYIFDLEGRFTYVNASLLALWQKQLSEAVGRNFFELDYPAELAELLQQQIQQVIRTRTPLKDESSYTSYLGERRYEYIFVPVIGADGEVEAVAGSTRDITERKELEDSLRQLAADLSESDRRKTEFLATLGHELRNPLAPIRTGLALMKMVADDSEKMEQTRSMMEVQAQQMVRLIDDLLDVSRITQGKFALKTCRVSLSEVIHNAVEASRPLIDEAGHQLSISLPQETLYLHADPNRLSQVFSNLLNNSAKYTPDGGQIQISATRQRSDLIVTIRDNGLGIPQEMQDSIFEMFNQIDRAVEAGHKGLGIGLTLVKRLVEMHGGSVSVRSDGKGHGSEFRVRLPNVVDSESGESRKGQDQSAVQRPRLRILVVDDNRAAAEMLGMVVRMLGNEVQTAHDGQQAVATAAKFQPQVVLMDLGMPRMNGYEAAKHIRQQPWGENMLLVALTGWGQDEDKQRAKAAGFDHHLVKPAEPSRLQQLLSEVH